jgi:hypothetical protein
MAAAVQERLIRLWASPQGALKAAEAGAGIGLLAMDRNLGRLLQDGPTTIGQTSVAWEGGKPVVTYPIPGVAGAVAKATLDKRYMAERVVVTQGSATTEFVHADYNDWNNPLNKIEAYYAGRMTERRNGTVVRDLTTVEIETGSVYAVMPVPASVRAAITPGQAAPPRTLFASDRTASLTSKDPTPRMANGKPDLTGSWGGGGMNWRYGNRRCGPTQLEGCSPQWNQTIGLRVRGAVALRAESSVVQARALGQGHRARHVDQQGRSRHDLSAARDSAAGPATAHRPDGERHHLLLFAVCRWRRRARRIPDHAD